MVKLDSKEVKRLKYNIEQLTIQRDEAQRLNKSNEEVIYANNMRQLRLYDSFIIEKIDLLGRIARIDQRITALGLTPNPDKVTIATNLNHLSIKNL